ncbi:MAG TPA: twin-arginine translocase TatA/TatE family subunit [Nitrososphaerales archaeon]|nr:twin-arginine translocase TatA/TatE family subunit [Nitrososphaerales archaeon]
MALDALEIVIIGVILIVIFLWGPAKIPELARALGRAKKEFDDASKGATDAFNSMAQPTQQPSPKSGDQILMETAQQLGISTEGKSREQISKEILAKSKTQ